LRTLLTVILLAGTVMALPSVASAQPAQTLLEGNLHGAKNPFRGSAITYRNAATAISFDEGAELTYNPNWAMSLEIAPRYWFGDSLFVMASIDFTREITNDDLSTDQGETWVGNTRLRVGAIRFYTIPEAEIAISANLDFILPTSKWAQEQTLYFGLQPSLRLSRGFDVLSGLNLGYGLSVLKNFNEFTTGELEDSRIQNCSATPGGCYDGDFNSGLRNVSWRLANSFDASLSFTEWMSLNASFAILNSFLYDAYEDDTQTYLPVENTDMRTALVYDVSVTFIPLSYLWVTAGASTFNPQQAPDSSNYAPFFNRFTTLYIDLRLDVADLVATATR